MAYDVLGDDDDGGARCGTERRALGIKIGGAAAVYDGSVSQSVGRSCCKETCGSPKV